jgi:hypothetical protein
LDGRPNPRQVLAAVWTTLKQIQCQDVRGTLDEEAMIFDALNKRVSRGSACGWVGLEVRVSNQGGVYTT